MRRVKLIFTSIREILTFAGDRLQKNNKKKTLTNMHGLNVYAGPNQNHELLLLLLSTLLYIYIYLRDTWQMKSKVR